MQTTGIASDQLVNGLQLSLVIVGVAITIPAFLVGGEVVAGLGLKRAAIAVTLGSAAVAVIAALTMSLAAKLRRSTYEIIRGPFGTQGCRLVTLVMATSLLGWFGVTAQLFGQALAGAIEQVANVSAPRWAMTLVGSGLMVTTTLFGFRAIERLSRFVVPLLLVLLVVAVWLSVGQLSPEALTANGIGSISSLGTGISVVIGAYMVAVTIAPDLARFVKTRGQATAAAFAGYGLGYGGVLMLAGIPGLLPIEGGYVERLVFLGLGVPALALVVFATWTTNCSNLYSASLAFDTLILGKRYRLVTVLAGAAGTLAGLAGLADNLVPYLVLLSIAVPPISGIYLSHYLLLRLTEGDENKGFAGEVPALLAWGVATGVAWLASNGYLTLTGVGSLDSFLVAGASYTLLRRTWPGQHPRARL
ncbi:MAG: cytosine permease [Pseudomonadota bacterium]